MMLRQLPAAGLLSLQAEHKKLSDSAFGQASRKPLKRPDEYQVSSQYEWLRYEGYLPGFHLQDISRVLLAFVLPAAPY